MGKFFVALDFLVNDRRQTGDERTSICVSLVDAWFPFYFQPDDGRLGRRSPGRSNGEDHFGIYHADRALPRGFADNQLRYLFRPTGLVDLVR